MNTLSVRSFFDSDTRSFTHLVHDPKTRVAAVIDPILGFDPASGRSDTGLAKQVLDAAREDKLEIAWILETHVHADHLSAAAYVKKETGARTAIGANITWVQNHFGKVFHAEPEFQHDGSQFDRLLSEGDQLSIGNLIMTAWHTPGHTPACMSYLIEDTAFIGDTLFMPDYGSARCDFPGGDASQLYHSVQRLFSLPNSTRLFLCHDYPSQDRETPCGETTVGQQKASNIHFTGCVSEAAFVAMREKRDAELDLPRLIIPSVQVNMRAGNWPPSEDNGQTYLKTPVDLL